jgi:spermidine dehydrogenase
MPAMASHSSDRALGMEARVTRRDFLNATLLASGGALLGGAAPFDLLAQGADFDGYGGVGDYARAHGDMREVVLEGHRIRDGAYARVRARDAASAGEFDCVVVGGGVSGLASALFFRRHGGDGRTCLVLDDHAIFGGLAKANEFLVDGHRLVANQASAMFFPPLAGTFLAEFYPSIGIPLDPIRYQTWTGPRPELPVGRTPYFAGGPTSAFYFGAAFGQTPGRLLVDPWGRRLDGAPIPDEAKRDLLHMRDQPGVRARRLPKTHGDEASRQLDRVTLEEHLMEAYGIGRDTIRRYLSPVTGGGSGIGADALSAYADYAADVLLPWRYDQGTQMFPGGNATVARHVVRALLPGAVPGPLTLEGVCHARVNVRALDRPGQPTRIRSGCTVFSVAHDGAPGQAGSLTVLYSARGKVYRVTAKSVILAGGSWTTKHVLRDLPETHRAAYAEFHRSPCLLANVAVRHWRFLGDLGIHECRWFEGIGNTLAVRKTATCGPVDKTISPDSPVVLTLKILFPAPGRPIAEQVTRGRAELLSTPFRAYERQIREQLAAMFGPSGFDARRDVAGIVLNRWGHAYLSPQPGFFFGRDGRPAPGEVLRRQPVGRVAFANSDVSGIMDHRASILEADRAARQVLERLE